jgi:hypothetical protein
MTMLRELRSFRRRRGAGWAAPVLGPLRPPLLSLVELTRTRFAGSFDDGFDCRQRTACEVFILGGVQDWVLKRKPFIDHERHRDRLPGNRRESLGWRDLQ